LVGSAVYAKILDYSGTCLPDALALSAFATTTMLTKNSFSTRSATIRDDGAAKACPSARPLRHVFRNAMLIVIAGFPALHRRLLRRLAPHRDDLLVDGSAFSASNRC